MNLCPDEPSRKFAVFCSDKRPGNRPCVGMLVLSSGERRFFFPAKVTNARTVSLWGIACKLKQRYGIMCVVIIWDGTRRHVVECCAQAAYHTSVASGHP